MLPHRLAVRLSLSLLATGTVAQAEPQEATAQLQQSMAARLAGHPFFGRIDFTTVTTHPPFVFYVQRPLQDDPEYTRKVINAYLPFLGELSRVFAAEYGKPPDGAPPPAFAIAVLASAGIYDDFARAVDQPSLHMARAHYDPELRLAVTHQVVFGHSDPREERHSLLHEFVHALQHSYGVLGAMTKPVWFNEGLAEYRSSCSNVAASLRDPPLDEQHVAAMAFGHAHPLGAAYVLPLAELVVPDSYAQVVEAVKKRGGARPDLALPMFYAQSEMTVRFLHEFEQGKYRAGFQRYFQAVMGGASGLPAFRAAFGAETDAALAAIEQDWLRWLSGVLQQRFPQIGDLTKGRPGGTRAVLPPPAACDRAPLLWRPEEHAERLAAVRRLCAGGRYETALETLPEAAVLLDAQKGPLQRERDRVQSLLTLREVVVADLDKRKASFQLDAAEGPVRGKFLRREQDAAVMLVGKAERRVPWSEFGPALLLRQGRILKQFEGDRRALEAYLLWLAGRRRDDKELKPMLAKGFPSVVDLRADLVADLDADYGLAALGLLELQQLELGDDPAAARAALVEFEQIVHRHGKHPLLQTRKTAVEQLARALAERAFTLSDAGAMGIRAQIEQLDDQRVRLRYAQPETAANLDFAPVPAEDLQLFQVTRIAYDGPTAITAAGKHWHLIGAGFLRWAVPLAGAQEIEIDFEVVGGQGDFALFLCREEGRWIWVSPDGQLQILDESTGMRDQVGKPTPLFLDKVHRLRVVHDGKKQVQTWLDGNLVATLPGVGNCLRGDLLLLVRSSEAIRLHGLVITGRLDPTDPLPLRERSVQEVLQRLWQ